MLCSGRLDTSTRRRSGGGALKDDTTGSNTPGTLICVRRQLADEPSSSNSRPRCSTTGATTNARWGRCRANYRNESATLSLNPASAPHMPCKEQPENATRAQREYVSNVTFLQCDVCSWSLFSSVRVANVVNVCLLTPPFGYMGRQCHRRLSGTVLSFSNTSRRRGTDKQCTRKSPQKCFRLLQYPSLMCDAHSHSVHINETVCKLRMVELGCLTDHH